MCRHEQARLSVSVSQYLVRAGRTARYAPGGRQRDPRTGRHYPATGAWMPGKVENGFRTGRAAFMDVDSSRKWNKEVFGYPAFDMLP